MASETNHEIAVSTKQHGEVAEPRTSPMFGSLDDVERLFDRLMPRNWIRSGGWGWPNWSGFYETLENIRLPHLDVIDRDKDVVIHVEVPGVDKKDISVSINDSQLDIKGYVKRESKEQKKDYFRCEIARGNFSRSLALPEGIDSSKISANLKDGILEIVLPKEEGTQRRSVEVK